MRRTPTEAVGEVGAPTRSSVRGWSDWDRGGRGGYTPWRSSRRRRGTLTTRATESVRGVMRGPEVANRPRGGGRSWVVRRGGTPWPSWRSFVGPSRRVPGTSRMREPCPKRWWPRRHRQGREGLGSCRRGDCAQVVKGGSVGRVSSGRPGGAVGWQCTVTPHTRTRHDPRLVRPGGLQQHATLP